MERQWQGNGTALLSVLSCVHRLTSDGWAVRQRGISRQLMSFAWGAVAGDISCWHPCCVCARRPRARMVDNALLQAAVAAPGAEHCSEASRACTAIARRDAWPAVVVAARRSSATALSVASWWLQGLAMAVAAGVRGLQFIATWQPSRLPRRARRRLQRHGRAGGRSERATAAVRLMDKPLGTFAQPPAAIAGGGGASSTLASMSRRRVG